MKIEKSKYLLTIVGYLFESKRFEISKLLFLASIFMPSKIMKKQAGNIRANELLQFIPENRFAEIIKDSDVDFQVKKLYGRRMFYLLLYGLLESSKTSLRSLEDIFNSTKFKVIFNLDKYLKTKYNSISDRLSTMNVDFFKNVFELLYSEFSKSFNEKESLSYNITRVDSTMVTEVANKISEGMVNGTKNKNGRKQIKYTVSLTNLLPSSVEVFTEQSYVSEDLAIPDAIMGHVDKSKDNVFVFDRGVQSRKAFNQFDNEQLNFVTRLNLPVRKKVIEAFDLTKNKNVNNLTIISDEKVYLFDKKGKKSNPFRLIMTKNQEDKKLAFLTNMFDCDIKEIIEIYKRRWDIEVFFRFIKQELNFSHFMSTNINGIKIILYMTLILSMLILLYKKFNKVGYKTAKRRFYYEVEELYMSIIIKLSGGDPNLVFR